MINDTLFVLTEKKDSFPVYPVGLSSKTGENEMLNTQAAQDVHQALGKQ